MSNSSNCINLIFVLGQVFWIFFFFEHLLITDLATIKITFAGFYWGLTNFNAMIASQIFKILYRQSLMALSSFFTVVDHFWMTVIFSPQSRRTPGAKTIILYWKLYLQQGLKSFKKGNVTYFNAEVIDHKMMTLKNTKTHGWWLICFSAWCLKYSYQIGNFQSGLNLSIS